MNFTEQLRQTGLSRNEISDYLGVSFQVARGLYSGDTEPFDDQKGAIIQLLHDMELLKAFMTEHNICVPVGSYLKIIGGDDGDYIV